MKSSSLKSKIFSGLFWKFGERITAQIISLVVSVILARLLSPEDYGAVALVMVFITLANVFVSNGLGNALIQKESADALDFSSVFYINIGVSFILYFIIFISAPYIALFYNMEILRPVLRILGIRIIIAAINSVQQAYVSKHMLFKRFFWSTLFGTLFSGIVGIILAFQGAGVWALVAQYLTNVCTDTCVLWFTVRWRPIKKFSWERSKGLFQFGWKILASSLLDTGYKQLRSLIIGKKYSSSDLAFYNQGDKYPSLIVVNINASISSVLFPALSMYQNDRKRIKQMTRRAIQISSFLLWPMMIGFGVIAEPLISLLLTDKWLACVPYIRIFCFTYGLWPIHTANLQAINALGRSDLYLKLEIIKKGIGIIAILLSMQISPLVMAGSLIVTDIISTFINAYPNTKLLDYKLLEQLKDVLSALILSCIMAICIIPIIFLNLSNVVTLILQIIVGALVYIGLSLITKQTALKYLIETMTDRRNK